MAQVQRPLRADAARGRVNNEVFSNSLGLSIVRKFTPPTNPRTTLQQAARAAFYYRQNWFLRLWDDYITFFSLAPAQDVTDYLVALSRQRELSPIAKKSFGGGFQSGSVLARPYYISKMSENGLILRKDTSNQFTNLGAATIYFTCFNADGEVVQATTSLAANVQGTLTSTASMIVFSTVNIALTTSDFLADLTTYLVTNSYPTTVMAATDWTVAQVQPTFNP
jgi:hypothetical protein